MLLRKIKQKMGIESNGKSSVLTKSHRAGMSVKGRIERVLKEVKESVM